MASIEFPSWLESQLKERDWSKADLARAANISPSQVTRIMAGERGVGEATAAAIARALKLPPEEVFRAAGMLPPQPEARSLTGELTYLVNMLDDDNLQDVVDYARQRLEKQERKKAGRENDPARNVSGTDRN